jgi:hypothetical protein
VTYADFLRLCCDAAGPDAGPSVARALDESRSVIVLGKTVFLRLDMVRFSPPVSLSIYYCILTAILARIMIAQL